MQLKHYEAKRVGELAKAIAQGNRDILLKLAEEVFYSPSESKCYWVANLLITAKKMGDEEKATEVLIAIGTIDSLVPQKYYKVEFYPSTGSKAQNRRQRRRIILKLFLSVCKASWDGYANFGF